MAGVIATVLRKRRSRMRFAHGKGAHQARMGADLTPHAPLQADFGRHGNCGGSGARDGGPGGVQGGSRPAWDRQSRVGAPWSPSRPSAPLAMADPALRVQRCRSFCDSVSKRLDKMREDSDGAQRCPAAGRAAPPSLTLLCTQRRDRRLRSPASSSLSLARCSRCVWRPGGDERVLGQG